MEVEAFVIYYHRNILDLFLTSEAEKYTQALPKNHTVYVCFMIVSVEGGPLPIGGVIKIHRVLTDNDMLSELLQCFICGKNPSTATGNAFVRASRVDKMKESQAPSPFRH